LLRDDRACDLRFDLLAPPCLVWLSRQTNVVEIDRQEGAASSRELPERSTLSRARRSGQDEEHARDRTARRPNTRS
jgi:hypothetical protein